MRNVVVGWAMTVLASMMPVTGFAAAPPEFPKGAAAPEPPREFVDTAMPPSTGRSILVAAGRDFQDALDEAELGDVIVLEEGATFTGPFSLPNKKRGAGWITIRSSGVDRAFPAPGTRVGPEHAPRMAVLTAKRGGGVVMAERGAHHYRFIGIEVKPHEETYLYSLMWFGNNRERSVEEQPHHIIVDRCYIHGDPQKGSRRGVSLNGRHQAVIDSYVSDFKGVGEDTQGLLGWSGSGPFKIVNNYVEGAGENVMFGGGDPIIRDLVPADIEIRHNHMAKPLVWKRGEPGYDGSSWTIKNLFELKNARRVLVDGNVLEYNWEEAQSGFAVLLTVRNQEGRAPWSAVEDVQFSNNIVRHSGSGITLMGHDNNRAWDESVETKRILIKNNLWDDIGGPRWGGRGFLFQLVEGTSDVAIEHNTGRQTGTLVFATGPPHKRFVFRNNVGPHNEWGIFGNAVGVGTKALEAYFPDAIVTGNVIVGGDKRQYPAGNIFPSPEDDDKLAGQHEGRSRLTTSALGGAFDGPLPKPGVDLAVLCRALGPLADRESVCRVEESRAR